MVILEFGLCSLIYYEGCVYCVMKVKLLFEVWIGDGFEFVIKDIFICFNCGVCYEGEVECCYVCDVFMVGEVLV